MSYLPRGGLGGDWCAVLSKYVVVPAVVRPVAYTELGYGDGR